MGAEGTMDDFRLDKTVFSVGSRRDPDDSLEYWLSRPPVERLRALEALRQAFYGYTTDTGRLTEPCISWESRLA
jgi:hypothetical protein